MGSFLTVAKRFKLFFSFPPWLSFLSGCSYGLWAEERKTGTIELLLTLPIADWQVVVGKFLAAWLLLLTGGACFPIMDYGKLAWSA